MKRRFYFYFWLANASFFLGLFAKITKDIFEHDHVLEIDYAILTFVQHIRVATIHSAVVDITALGSPTLISIFTIIGILILWLNKDTNGIIYLLSSAIGAGIWTWIIKFFVGRERPQVISHLVVVSGRSYPSGHTLAAAAVYLAIGMLLTRNYASSKIKIAIIISALLIINLVGFSRIYLGVHYPSDVASGIFLGIAWTLFLTGFYIKW